MSDFRSAASIDGGVLLVHLLSSPAARSAPVECVVDLTRLGEVVGVEVLDLKRQLAVPVVEAPESDGGVRWSYDDEIDALYLRITNERGQVQKTAKAEAKLDSLGRLVELSIRMRCA